MNTKKPVIPMAKVKSSQVDSIGYDPATNTLAVKFIRTPAEYHYPDVTADDYAALQKAESIGSHIHKHFVAPKRKFNKFPNA